MAIYIDRRPSFKNKYENWWNHHPAFVIGIYSLIVSLIMFLLATFLPYSRRAYTRVPTEVIVVDKYRNTNDDYRIVYKILNTNKTVKHTVSFDEYDKTELTQSQICNIRPSEYEKFGWYWFFWVVFWIGIIFGIVFIIIDLLD